MRTGRVMSNNLVASIMVVFTAFFVASCSSQPNYESFAIPKSFHSQQCYITQGESYIWLEQEDEWLTLPEISQQQFEQAQINWLEENILIVSLGQKTTAGFDLKLTSWLMEQSHWQVERHIQMPKAGTMQARISPGAPFLSLVTTSISAGPTRSTGLIWWMSMSWSSMKAAKSINLMTSGSRLKPKT